MSRLGQSQSPSHLPIGVSIVRTNHSRSVIAGVVQPPKPGTVPSQPFCHLQKAVIGEALLPAVGRVGGGGAVVPRLDAVGVGHAGGQGVGGQAGLGQVGPARHGVQLLLLLRLVLVPAWGPHTHTLLVTGWGHCLCVDGDITCTCIRALRVRGWGHYLYLY